MMPMSRLRDLRVKNGYATQADLAKVLYVNQTAVSQWERGVTTPSPAILLRLSQLYGVSTDYLLGSDGPGKKLAVKIPVYRAVAAGIPIEATDEIVDWEEIEPELAGTGKYFALRVQGQSMEPRICDGDVVIVRQQEDASTGDVAIVLVNGNDATCKRIKKDGGGLWLLPNNPAYNPVFYSADEIATLPVRIIGKVVELRGKF